MLYDIPYSKADRKIIGKIIGKMTLKKEETTYEQRWDKALASLREKNNSTIYNTWLSPVSFVKYEEGSDTLYLKVQGPEFKYNNVRSRYYDIIRDEACEFFEKLRELIFLPDVAADETDVSGLETPQREYLISPLKTFETFIVGDNSRFAYAAALSVAETAKKPDMRSNPLFIYGGSGLGKTHLMQSVANYVLNHFPSLKMLYVSSETFTNDYVVASQSKKMSAFKEKYRTKDILMIDDIQFIEAKEKTIEEVFHTYNTLYNLGKQLIFTSDRPPKDLLGLDDRLKSRLSSGLIVNIQPPAFEIKVAILRNKALLENIELTPGMMDVINIIAEKIKTNVREMEGAFNRVVAFSTLSGQAVTKTMARQALKDIINADDVLPTPETVKRVVSKYYGVKIGDLESSSRSRIFSVPRQVSMYFCREMLSMPLTKIAELFKRDHTTVMYACDKVLKDIRDNESFSDEILKMEEMIRTS